MLIISPSFHTIPWGRNGGGWWGGNEIVIDGIRKVRLGGFPIEI